MGAPDAPELGLVPRSGRGQALLEGIDETFDELRLEPQEFIDAGDRVATRLRHHGRGKRSGVEIDEEMYHQVATFRAGKMVRIEYFGEWSEALKAAGLSERDAGRSE